MSPDRSALLDALAGDLLAARTGTPLRVAVDGVTAAGKSTFAAELAAAVRRRGAEALHLSTDDYHHVAEHRRRDPDRARGYLRDAYDLAAFRTLVLDPLAQDGRYRPRLHDLATDEVLDEPDEVAPPEAVVVVDGSFLQSADLAGGWDVVVWLATSYDVAVGRAVPRDAALFGDEAAVRAAYDERYHAACRRYVAEVDPQSRADVVVDNDDLDHPVLVRRLVSSSGPSARQ